MLANALLIVCPQVDFVSIAVPAQVINISLLTSLLSFQ
jgi:hypothetical protein